MAFFCASSSSSKPQNGFKDIQNTVKITYLIDDTCMQKAQGSSIAQDQAVNYFPTEDYNFLPEYHSSTDDFCVEYLQKLKKFKNILSKLVGDPFEGLNMVDAILRLGIEYHFQEEIETILKRQYMIFSAHAGHDHDLYEAALRFRLLRQDGYHVSADVFNKFKNKEGNFKLELGEHISGLMELYDASEVSINEEDILDEAKDFSRHLLEANLKHLDHQQARFILNTLEHPYHKSLPRFMAKDLPDNFKGARSWVKHLQELAKMDFKMVQSIHQQELLQIFKWWKGLGLAKKLNFARNQPLKWYMWTAACLTDPSLTYQRVELTKPIAMVYVIDDLFDVYGTLDELTLFTNAVNRWELSATEKLSDSLKICFVALYDITNEISYKVYKRTGWNPIDSLKKAWASLCNAFLIEAQWFASGNLPKAEEYMKNAHESTGIHVVLVYMFFLLGEGISKETVELLDSNPSITSSVATILRLWDDLGNAQDEDQNGHDGSYIECYRKERQGCSVEDAKSHVFKMISNAWKQLNKDCLNPNPFPASFIKASLNFARMVPLMYSYDEKHRLPSLEEHMKSLIFKSDPYKKM
ncbi:(3S,6E)-nerolidol synthase 1-like [Castanea sativa]|uniref:(3S,6E)-nerolidol synthase 1-like n=1 Tax=Castanea sativa TaxID=21020 RepID=UPI003F64C016